MSPPRDSQDESLSQVAVHLERDLGVQRCHVLSAFLEPAAGETLVIVRPRPLVLGHLELYPDLCIHDAELGTVGLAWMFADATTGSGFATDDSAHSRNEGSEPVAPQAHADQAIREFVERCIDDAVALRHLCLERARRDRQGRARRSDAPRSSRETTPADATSSLTELPLAVEAVLMVPRSQLPSVGRALRSIVADSGYLYSVGVNVLPLEASLASLEMARNVRRAFRWLLRSTRGRFEKPSAPGIESRHSSGDGGPAASAAATGAPATNGTGAPAHWSSTSRLHLKNYRLQGGRSLELQRFTRPIAAPIHLLFGRNGTGKSSLVEAVEIALTGKLEFFEEVNRGLEYASVLRNTRAAQSDTCEISVEAEHASMDVRITDKPCRTPRNGEPLPPAIPAAACRLDQRLMDKLITSDRKAERAAILLKLLFPQDRGLLAKYEDAQRDRRATPRLPSAEEIDLARQALGGLALWTPSHSTAAERKSRAELTNEWLQGRALLEMVSEDQRLGAVLQSLDSSWTARHVRPIRAWIEAERPPLPDEVTLRTLEQRVNALRARLAKPAAPTQAPPRAAFSLSAQERSVLDAIGPWIAQSPSRGLGDALATAIEHEQVERFADVEVGREGWAESLARRLKTLEEAASALRDQEPSRFPVLAKEEEHHFRQLLQERATLQTALDLESEVDQQLRARIGALGEPLNEIVSLLTPARWAYDDIATQLEGVHSEGEATKVGVAGGTGTNRAGVTLGIAAASDTVGSSASHPLELRLNTAELNILALAIFLLCAPRADENAFKLFVLDDPLQNMDELTVSCVARGLARLQRIWPRDWRALLTVHGEVNFQCLARELFGAGYVLPWLSPGDSRESLPIELKALTIASDAQPQTLQSLARRGLPS